MKKFLAVIIGIIVFILGFYLQHLFVNYAMSLLPTSISEWYRIIKLILYVFTFSITLTLSISCGIITTLFISER